MNNKIFLISPDDVKAKSQINYNVDDSTVSTAIRDAQNIYLRDIIGDSLLERLQELVVNGIDEPENAAYLDLLDNYVSEYLAYEANVQICVPISFKLRNMGVVSDTDTNVQAAQIQGVEYVQDYYRTQSIDKANRMIDFIIENKSAFPEINSPCVCGKKGARLIKRANTNLHL